MQFKIPQNVQREDKIVGPLTLRQLIIVGIGGGIDYSLYTILSRQYLIEVWLLPVLFIAVITALFAFFHFHDIPFEKLIFVFIEYKFKPQKRTWKQMKGDVFMSVLNEPKAREKSLLQNKEVQDSERRKKLAEITTLMDTHGQKMSARAQITQK